MEDGPKWKTVVDKALAEERENEEADIFDVDSSEPDNDCEG